MRKRKISQNRGGKWARNEKEKVVRGKKREGKLKRKIKKMKKKKKQKEKKSE